MILLINTKQKKYICKECEQKKKTKKNNQNDVATEPTIRTLCHQKSIIVAKSKDLIDAPTDDSIIEVFFLLYLMWE